MAKRAAAQPSVRASEPATPALLHAPERRITRLDDVLGQVHAKRTLQAALDAGRVHHAWIFHGPAGVGKRTAAVAFAAALLDPTTQPDLSGRRTPEAGSPVSTLVAAGTHPDLHVVTKELAAISREQTVRAGKQLSIARAVLDEFVLEPAARTRILPGASLAGKVFIIDEAELIAPAVQNVLLKTLEEPPAGTVFVLVTSAEDRLLPTIRSRCQRVPFTPLDDAEMGEWVRLSGLSVDADRAKWVLRYSGGSPGAASVAVEHDLFAWEAELGPMLDDLARGRFALNLSKAMYDRIEERAGDAVKRDPQASKDAANKLWARRMLSFVAERHRSALRARAKALKPDQAGEDETTLRLLAGIDAVTEAERAIASNTQVGFALDAMIARTLRSPALV
jgi:DNA polymerase III subunit delta'